jgi:hypothetical protein
MAHVETLTGPDIEFGKVLWNALRSNKAFPANGALWLYESESDQWHLLIASPLVDQVGPRKAYEQLSAVTRHIHADDLQLLKIELISPKQPLYEALRSVFGKNPSGEGVRLGNTQVGGMYIDEAYLYEIG